MIDIEEDKIAAIRSLTPSVSSLCFNSIGSFGVFPPVFCESCSDSVATRGRAQGQAVIEYLGKRPAMKHQSLVGSVTAASRFDDTKRNLTEQLTHAVQSMLPPSLEHDQEQSVLQSLRHMAWISATLNIGAITSAFAIGVELVDPIPGLLASSSLAIGGGALWTTGVYRIRQRFQDEWASRATKLEGALQAICDKELERVNRRILNGVAPYTRFVESEQERIDLFREECEGVCVAARNLRNRISKLE